MTTHLDKCCSLILLEYFGEIVQKVGCDLYAWGPKPLALIARSTNLSSEKVREALCVLIQYGLAKCKPGKSEKFKDYYLVPENVVLILQYPRFVHLAKSQCGELGEILIEELLRHGFLTASQLILHTIARLKDYNIVSVKPGEELETVKNKLFSMINQQFLMQCPSSEDEPLAEINPLESKSKDKNQQPSCDSKYKEMQLFVLPEISLKVLQEKLRGHKMSEDPGDNDTFWKINFNKFHQELRDQILLSAVKRRVDGNGSDLMRLLLQLMYIRTDPWVPSSNPLPYSELKDSVRKASNPILLQYLDQYLGVLERDSTPFLTRVGDSGGGQFVLNMAEIFEQIAWTCVENIITERFGSKGARIFRLVRARKFVELDDIQQYAMIPAKEAKHLSYRLLEENFLQLQELRRSVTASAGPNKTFFLFHINFIEVSQMTLEMCFKSLANAMTRREYETTENKRLIEKQIRFSSMVKSLREQGAPEENIKEVEEMISPPEKTLLAKVQSTIKKLGEAELQLQETVFLLQLHLRYYFQKR